MTLQTDPTGTAPVSGPSVWRRIDRADLARTLFVAACAIAVALGLTGPWPRVPVLAVVGLVVGCWPILTEAFADLRRRRMSMELSMLIAIIAAAAIGEWVTALVITAFVLAAEILEDLSMSRGRDALTDLMSFLPQTVRIRRGTDLIDRPLADVVPGDIVVIAPGGRTPVDGTVVAGSSAVDQSRITGESMPVEIGVGDQVYAGSTNQVGAVEVRAERVGTESSYGQIMAAVARAQDSEPPVQRLADRLAAWLIYLAIIGAVITFVLTRDLTATIAVIVVAGACGIAAGTPLAALGAIARIARNGAFVKDGAHLEALSTIDTVVFDKTGTLTTGTPTVMSVRGVGGITPARLLTLAASVEAYSEHPLGEAVVAHARDRECPIAPVAEFGYRPGLGVTGLVDGIRVTAGSRGLVPDAPADAEATGSATAIHVALDGKYAGTILLADAVRDGARAAVAELHRLGLRTMIITGDREVTARAVADELGIDDVRAGLLPEEKLAAIDAERAAGHRLAMVGDGVNDAPALARADVGIAMGSGTEIARESADVVLISSDLGDLVHTVQVARRARRIVLVNFVGTIVVDLVGIALAAYGLLSPILAAFIHVGSETAFILNSARLIPVSRTSAARRTPTPRGTVRQRSAGDRRS
ncbi:heavy metal translocating P-type ATPase [Granulicoccus phenolivorans]|uniref:heavy metal translocating P-type ATPase n=1 Tax=Granulicoccus phenolivorans TaxID=266854 RepID=UPI0003FE2B2B|nr:cation-translocating P-type ATPase [Granulicoccus phenolivorans]